MKKCVIFCAGEFDKLAAPVEDAFVIAADGGYAHTKKLGLQPDAVLGDFDSLGYVPQDAQVFPVEKDDTDTMLAVRRGLFLGYRQFLLYGSLDGPRLDHTVANFQTLQFLADRDAIGYLIGSRQLVTVVKNGTLIFPETAKGIVSVFCLGQDAHGVSLESLHYTLHDGKLTGGFPLGVSNHIMEPEATVSVRKGALAIGWELEPLKN